MKKLLVLLILLAALYVFRDTIAIHFFAKANGLEISYKRIFTLYPYDYFYRDVKVTDKKSGLGFKSSFASLSCLWDNGPAVQFKLTGISFLKKDTAGKKQSYDTLGALVAIPFDSQLVYGDASGQISGFKDGIYVKNFIALGRTTKLTINGHIDNSGTIDADILISLAPSLTQKTPDELSKIILSDEKEGWKSLSVKLSGDIKDPSVQVSSKRFRLNIRTVTKD